MAKTCPERQKLPSDRFVVQKHAIRGAHVLPGEEYPELHPVDAQLLGGVPRGEGDVG